LLFATSFTFLALCRGGQHRDLAASESARFKFRTAYRLFADRTQAPLAITRTLAGLRRRSVPRAHRLRRDRPAASIAQGHRLRRCRKRLSIAAEGSTPWPRVGAVVRIAADRLPVFIAATTLGLGSGPSAPAASPARAPNRLAAGEIGGRLQGRPNSSGSPITPLLDHFGPSAPPGIPGPAGLGQGARID